MKSANVWELKVPSRDLPGADPVTVLEWHVHEGESVARDQPLLDLVTPLGLTRMTARSPGRVTEILVDEGARVERGQTLALLLATNS